MNDWAKRVLAVCLVLLVAGSGAARGDDEGQPLLDQAIEKKLSASNVSELGEVIDLAQQALDKGLSEDNAEFAKKLLTSSLLQRATAMVQAALRGLQTDQRWLAELPKVRELAMADLERLLALDAEQHEAHYLVGRLQALPGGDRERGLKALDEAARLTEEPEVKAKILTTRATLQEKPEKQLEDLDAALELDPALGEALERRGRLRLELGKYEEALEDLNAALENQPDNAVLLEAKGICLLQMQKVEEAMAAFDRAIEIEPRMFATYVHRARVFMAQGKIADAIDELDKSLLINNGNAAAYLLRASCYQQINELEKAKRDIDRMLEIQPDSLTGLRAKANLLAGGGELEEATKLLEELREKAPDDAEVLVQLALVYRTTQRVSDAIRTLDALAEKKPELGAAYRLRGDAYLSIGRQKEALADYEEALKHEPENATLLNNAAWVMATSPDDSLRDGKRAIELATKACELTQHKAGFILSTLAAAYAESGDFESALKWIKEALEHSDEGIKEQVAKEQASYEEKKPWRELQTVEDKSEGEKLGKAAEEKPAEEAPAEEKPAEDKPKEDQPKDEAPPEGGDAPKANGLP